VIPIVHTTLLIFNDFHLLTYLLLALQQRNAAYLVRYVNPIYVRITEFLRMKQTEESEFQLEDKYNFTTD